MSQTTEILDQHGAINRHTQRVLGAITEANWSGVNAELDRLFDTVNSHFELEESGGYLVDVLTADPTTEPELAKLEAAHARLQETLREIRLLAAGRESWDPLRELFLKWIDHLAAHEAAENRLLQAHTKS